MGKKLTVFMIDGTAYGPRLGEIGNWVGLGRNSNGFVEWVNKAGFTFKEVQEKLNR
ncbi:MAG: hypothetical protein NWR72_00260 [Bacteroidia bacterium]|nr:hypothetical protein [Bacteroidia bacterium]